MRLSSVDECLQEYCLEGWCACMCVCVCEEERFWPMNPCCALSSSTVSILSKWSLGMQYTHAASLPISLSIRPSVSLSLSLSLSVCLSQSLFVSVSHSVSVCLSLSLYHSSSLPPSPFFSLPISRQRQQTSTVIWGGCIRKQTHTLMIRKMQIYVQGCEEVYHYLFFFFFLRSYTK